MSVVTNPTFSHNCSHDRSERIAPPPKEISLFPRQTFSWSAVVCKAHVILQILQQKRNKSCTSLHRYVHRSWEGWTDFCHAHSLASGSKEYFPTHMCRQNGNNQKMSFSNKTPHISHTQQHVYFDHRLASFCTQTGMFEAPASRPANSMNISNP